MTAQKIEAVPTIAGAGVAREIDDLADRLHPDVNRAQVLERLDAAFRAGSPKICPSLATVFHKNGNSAVRRSSAVARQ